MPSGELAVGAAANEQAMVVVDEHMTATKKLNRQSSQKLIGSTCLSTNTMGSFKFQDSFVQAMVVLLP